MKINELKNQIKEKRDEVFTDGKTPFERSEGILSIYLWRILGLLFTIFYSFVLYITYRLLFKIFIQFNFLKLIMSVVIICIIGIIIYLTGERVIALIEAKIKKIPFEFIIITKPLLYFYLFAYGIICIPAILMALKLISR